MVNVVVSDGGSIKRVMNILSGHEGAIRRSVRNASIDALRATRAEIPRQLSARYTLTPSEVRRRMTVKTVVEDGGMRCGILISGAKLPIMSFEHQPRSVPVQSGVPVARRRPIMTRVLRNGAVVSGRRNRFMVALSSGHQGIFHRTQGAQSLPIDQSGEYRPAIPQLILEHKQIRPALIKKGEETFQRALLRNVRGELAKLKEKG